MSELRAASQRELGTPTADHFASATPRQLAAGRAFVIAFIVLTLAARGFGAAFKIVAEEYTIIDAVGTLISVILLWRVWQGFLWARIIFIVFLALVGVLGFFIGLLKPSVLSLLLSGIYLFVAACFLFVPGVSAFLSDKALRRAQAQAESSSPQG